jgi:hypothetical protein
MAEKNLYFSKATTLFSEGDLFLLSSSNGIVYYFLLMGWDFLVLRPLLTYCTSPR